MRALVVCNPYAGRQSGAGSLDGVLEVLTRAGWSVDVEPTRGPGDATHFARAAVDTGIDAVLAAGGDGTLNEVVQALASTRIPLGYLPYGTVNIWARELGLPLDPAQAARCFVEGTPRDVDLGCANGRYFLLMAGIGFDAEVVRHERALDRYKRRFGVLPYAAAGAAALTHFRGADLELRYDGLIRRVQALMLVLGNTRLYAGFMRFTPRAIANDGWLDLCIIKGKGVPALARQGPPLLLTRTVTYANVELLRVRDLTVRAEREVPLQLDGELVGETPVNFGIEPRALRVMVPPGFTSELIPGKGP